MVVSEVKSGLTNAPRSSFAGNKDFCTSEETRRVIAEDPEWSLAIVPLLKDLVIDHISRNFARNPIVEKLPPKDKALVFEKLATDLPLEVTANLISDEGYWRRCCKSKWEVCDVTLYDGSWKQMFFERYMENLIESYIPLKTDNVIILKALYLSAKFVKRLVIRQLLPPVSEPQPSVDETASDYGSDVSLSLPSMDHFEFSLLSHKSLHLEDLRVAYRVKDCGMNFEWNLFNFTFRDCTLLAFFVKTSKFLRCISINESNVDDAKARILMKHFLDHPVLKEIDLSHNCIKDKGARAVAKLINNRCPNLTKVDLYDNEIGAAGARAIAYALKQNRKLEELNLRLNRIGNEGGEAVCKSLVNNTSLRVLNLSYNDLGEPTAAVLSHVLRCNCTLKSIIFSGNVIGKDGGKQLQDGIESNNTLLELDLRLVMGGRESEYYIREKLKSNQERLHLM